MKFGFEREIMNNKWELDGSVGWRHGKGTHGLWIRAWEDMVKKGQCKRAGERNTGQESKKGEKKKEHDVPIIGYPIHRHAVSEEKYTAPSHLLFWCFPTFLPPDQMLNQSWHTIGKYEEQTVQKPLSFLNQPPPPPKPITGCTLN